MDTTGMKKRETMAAETIQTSYQKVLPFDGGNRFLKWMDASGRVRAIPSYIKDLEPWEDAQHDEDSVVIDCEGQRFAVGQVAKDLGGMPTFEGDKCQEAWRLLLAAITPEGNCNNVHIGKLTIVLPDSRKQTAIDSIFQIQGEKEMVRNGRRITCRVDQIEAIDETVPAFTYAVDKGIFLYKRTNGILDLGGGTGIGRLFSPNGTIIREADVIVPGSYDLARLIAAAMMPQLGHTADLSLIMDGIAQGSFLYGTSGISFQTIFPKMLDRWLGNIRSHLKVHWGRWIPDIGEVLIVGGSAPLARPIEVDTQGRFKIAVNPDYPNFSQIISLLGLAGL